MCFATFRVRRQTAFSVVVKLSPGFVSPVPSKQTMPFYLFNAVNRISRFELKTGTEVLNECSTSLSDLGVDIVDSLHLNTLLTAPGCIFFC
jgi:hypothetical protein